MSIGVAYLRVDGSDPNSSAAWPCELPDLTVCEWHGDGLPASIRGPAGEDGILVRLQLGDLGAHTCRARGSLHPLDVMPSGSIMLHDLQDDPTVSIAAASHCVLFFVSRGAFRRVLERSGGGQREALQTEIVALDPVIHSLAMCMLPELGEHPECSSAFVQHLALALVAHVVAAYAKPTDQETARGGLAGWQIRRAKEMLASDLMKRSDLTDIARECGLSVSHFARSFRHSVGDTPHGWLIKRRLETAQTMLRESSAPLAEVALTCGFADQSHFTRLFSREMGVSPGSWRKAFVPDFARELAQ